MPFLPSSAILITTVDTPRFCDCSTKVLDNNYNTTSKQLVNPHYQLSLLHWYPRNAPHRISSSSSSSSRCLRKLCSLKPTLAVWIHSTDRETLTSRIIISLLAFQLPGNSPVPPIISSECQSLKKKWKSATGSLAGGGNMTRDTAAGRFRGCMDGRGNDVRHLAMLVISTVVNDFDLELKHPSGGCAASLIEGRTLSIPCCSKTAKLLFVNNGWIVILYLLWWIRVMEELDRLCWLVTCLRYLWHFYVWELSCSWSSGKLIQYSSIYALPLWLLALALDLLTLAIVLHSIFLLLLWLCLDPFYIHAWLEGYHFVQFCIHIEGNLGILTERFVEIVGLFHSFSRWTHQGIMDLRGAIQIRPARRGWGSM